MCVANVSGANQAIQPTLVLRAADDRRYAVQSMDQLSECRLSYLSVRVHEVLA